MKLSSEQWYAARNVNIADACDRLNIPLKKWGTRLKLEGFGGLYIYDCVYYRWANQEWGNAIDFFVNYFNMLPDAAATMLLSVDNSYFPNSESISIKSNKMKMQKESDGMDCSLPELSKDIRRVIAYLTKTRHIDSDIVLKMIKKNLIAQDMRGNAVFLWYDILDQSRYNLNNIRGYELKGTSPKRFQSLSPNNKSGLGFNFIVGSKITKVFFFEAAIDAISFYEIHMNSQLIQNSLFISMQTLGIKVIFDTEAMLNMSFDESNCFMCVDNDSNKSENYAAAYLEKLKNQLNLKFTSMIPSTGDWNDELIKMKRQCDASM